MVSVDSHGLNPIVFDGFRNPPDSTALVCRDWKRAQKEAMYKGCSALDEIVQTASGQLGGHVTNELSDGFSKRDLACNRTFYLLDRLRSPIFKSVIAKLPGNKKLQSLSAKSSSNQKSQSRTGQSLIFQSAPGKSAIPQTAIHAREDQLHLPNKEELRTKLEEWAREVGDE